MRIKETKVYTFDELSETAQQKAIEKLGDLNVTHEWWESTYDAAARIGLKIEAFDIDRGSYVKGKFTLDAIEVAAKIKQEHGEQCETYKDAVSFIETRDRIVNNWPKDEDGELIDVRSQLNEIGEDFLNTIREDFRIILSEEHDHLTSREQIVESIRANEYEFEEDGTQA